MSRALRIVRRATTQPETLPADLGNTRKAMVVRTMQESRPTLQVQGFTDPETVEAILRSGEALTATWDGRQVVWR